MISDTDSSSASSALQPWQTVADARNSPSALSCETGLDAATAALVPPHHHGDWISLGLAERERVRELLDVMQAVERDDRGVVKALQVVALQNNGRGGWAFSNLRTLFYAWKGAGRDWRVLARKYRRESSLPGEFVDFLRALVLREHRSRKQAIHRVREAWREGRPVPGYGTWREWFASTWPDRDVPKHFANDWPNGWGNSNLYDRMPSRVQHALATKGRAAAEKMLPHVVRDPSTLRFLELVTIDDFETDVRAIYGREVVKVRGVLAIDVATRTVLAAGFKPAVEGDEGQRIAITRSDTQGLLRAIFESHGVPRDYPMTILCENAAAAVTAELEASLDIFFGGQVRVTRTSMLNFKTLANGFLETGGRPNLKGWIESFFNLAWNRVGSLPGQKGSRYDNKPGDLEAKLKAVAKLAAYETTDGQWAQFRMPFMSFDALQTAFAEVFAWMENRTEHKLLGFDEVRAWRLGPGDEPKPLDQLALLAPAEQDKVEILTRMESPAERREKLKRGVDFLKVPAPVIALLAFQAKNLTLKNHRATFTLNGAGYTYAESDTCKLRTRAGGRIENGAEITGYFDDKAMARLYCFTKDLAYLGELARLGAPVDIKDDKALGESAAAIARFYHAEVEAPVKRLLAADRANADAAGEHNTALLSRWGLMPPADRKKQSLSRTLADDRYDVPAGQRFAAGNAAARAIGASAHCAQEALATRNRLRARAERISDEDRDSFLECGLPNADCGLPEPQAGKPTKETLADYLPDNL